MNPSQKESGWGWSLLGPSANAMPSERRLSCVLVSNDGSPCVRRGMGFNVQISAWSTLDWVMSIESIPSKCIGRVAEPNRCRIDRSTVIISWSRILRVFLECCLQKSDHFGTGLDRRVGRCGNTRNHFGDIVIDTIWNFPIVTMGGG